MMSEQQWQDHEQEIERQEERREALEREDIIMAPPPVLTAALEGCLASQRAARVGAAIDSWIANEKEAA